MSSGFPAENAPLTDDTFNTAYNVILHQIAKETPPSVSGNGNDGSFNLESLNTDHVTDTMDKWRTYTKDGDLSRLPTGGAATPWDHLAQIRAGDLVSDSKQLNVSQNTLSNKWTGSASQKYEIYMETMGSHLDNYTKLNDGYLDSAAAVLKAAFTVEVAFKKDLLEAARSASKALDALENGKAGEDFGLFLVGIAALSLGALGPFMAASEIAAVVFVNGVVGSLASGFAFSDLKDKGAAVTGDNPAHIMSSLNSTLDTIVSKYKDSAAQVIGKMDQLSTSLNAETQGIKGVAQVPRYDPTGNTPGSFKLTDFFPDTVNGNDTLTAKITNPTP